MERWIPDSLNTPALRYSNLLPLRYSNPIPRPLWTYDVNHLDRLTEREDYPDWGRESPVAARSGHITLGTDAGERFCQLPSRSFEGHQELLQIRQSWAQVGEKGFNVVK